MRGALTRHVVGGVWVRGAGALLAFLLTTVLARSLGPEAYGTYAFCLSLATLLAIPAHMGLPTLIVREVAIAQETRQWSLMRGILLWANRMALRVAAGLAIVSVLGAWILLGGSADEQFRTQALAFALVPLISLAGVRAGALRGLDRAVLGQLPERVIRPGTLFALLILSSLASDLRAETAMLLHVIAGLVAFIAGAWMLRRVLPREARQAEPEWAAPQWLRSLGPLALLSGIQVINNQTDVVMLGLLASRESVGVYSVAAQGGMLVSFTLTVVNLVIAPYLARLYVAKDRAQLQRAATWAANVSTAVALPAALGLIVFGDLALTGVFGIEFIAGYPALVILCIGQSLNAAFGPVVLLLNMTGHEKDTMQGVAAATVANVLLNILLIPKFGATGAAFATATSLALWNILLSVLVHRRINIISVPILARRWAP